MNFKTIGEFGRNARNFLFDQTATKSDKPRPMAILTDILNKFKQLIAKDSEYEKAEAAVAKAQAEYDASALKLEKAKEALDAAIPDDLKEILTAKEKGKGGKRKAGTKAPAKEAITYTLAELTKKLEAAPKNTLFVRGTETTGLQSSKAIIEALVEASGGKLVLGGNSPQFTVRLKK